MSAPGKRFQRRLDVATTVVFLAMIVAPMAAMWLRTGAEAYADESEKRALASAPTPPRSWAEAVRWPDRVDAYLQDRFGFRTPLIRLHSRLLYQLFRTSSSPKVVVGRDGWLYYNGDVDDGRPIADYRGTEPLAPAKLEWLRWMIQDQHEWLRDRGIRYLFVIVPSKEQIHPEHLPPAVTRIGAATPREQLLEHLAGRGLPVLDLAPALREAARNGPVFHRTDTHWNDAGCFAANRAILDALGGRPEPDDAYVLQSSELVGGDLARMLNLSAMLRETVMVRVPRAPRRGDPRPVGVDETADIVGGVGDPALPSAVVYRDSFTGCLIPLLTEQFRDVRYTWGRYGAKMSGVEDSRPDIVLQIMADRVFRMNVKYSPAVQQERLQRRFEAAPETVWRRDSWTSELPPPRDVRRHLPVLQVEVTAHRPVSLSLRWGAGGESRCNVQPGRGKVYLPVLDPDAAPPYQLHARAGAGDFEVHSLELREIAR